jgi:hypothetical protein
MRVKLLLVLAVVLALAAFLTVVLWPSDGTLASGPLGPPGNRDTLCLPVPLGGADTDGFQSFTNGSHDVLVIDRVYLASARNLRLVGAYIVPVTGPNLTGTWGTFPPPAEQLPRSVQWAKRQRPADARVLPGEEVNVVAGLAPTSRATGSTAGIAVLYHDGSTKYALRSNIRVQVKVPPARCS